MRVSCPACAAAYEVPDRLIGAGRRLRCARCGRDWLVEPAAAEAAPPASAEAPPATAPPAAATAPPEAAEALGGDPTAATEPAPRAPRPRRAPQVIDPPLPRLGDAPAPQGGRMLALAWAGTLLVVLALVGGLALFREEITTAWPPAARLYLALGLGTRT